MGEHALDVKLRKLAVQHEDDDAEDDQGRERAGPADHTAFVALCALAHDLGLRWP